MQVQLRNLTNIGQPSVEEPPAKRRKVDTDTTVDEKKLNEITEKPAQNPEEASRDTEKPPDDSKKPSTYSNQMNPFK